MATFAYSIIDQASLGNKKMVRVRAVWNSSTYTSGGEPITATGVGLDTIQGVVFEDSGGYTYDAVISAGTTPLLGAGYRFLLKAYAASAITPSGTVAAPTGTNTAVAAEYHLMTLPYIKGSKNTSYDGTDKDTTDFTNYQLYSTLAAANNTTPLTIALQPEVPRNIVICHKNNSGGAAVAQVACTYAIVGTFNGAAQTDTITFADTSNVANGKYRAVYGVKPFDTITSITPSLSQNANMQRCAGPGSLLGFPTALSTPAEADVVLFSILGVPVSITGTVSTANNTIATGVRTDADSVTIKYARKGYIATPAWTSGAAPVFTGSASATGASEMSGSMTATIDMMVIGY
jgi:hypothetical protein